MKKTRRGEREVYVYTEKEREVKEVIDEHVQKVGGCLSCFKGCLDAFLWGDRARCELIHGNCDNAEAEADVLRRKIGDYLYSGAFLSMERKDIYMMARFVDKIANKVGTASDVVVYQGLDVPEDCKETLHEIFETIAKMFCIFQEAVRLFSPSETLQASDNLATIREKVTAIGVMESEIDDKEYTMMRTIFRSELPLAHKIHLERFVRQITEVSDVIGDAAGRLDVLVISERI